MSNEAGQTLQYKRSNFVTQLPMDYRYSPSHCWLARLDDQCWRIGLTKFATRMLGEMVDHQFDIQPGAAVSPGQVLGWVEGFKAISDLFCVGNGQFVESNPALREKITLINQDPYGQGWLYTIKGTPDAKCVDVHQYRDLLDKTIDRLLAQKKASENQEGTR